jgi:transcriptional regulator with XRE-family HTH domain
MDKMHTLELDVNPVATSDMSITPAQCRGARAMLGLDQAALADLALVHRNTIMGFESGRKAPTRNNLLAIQAALESAGVEFIPENGGGPGVRLRKEHSSEELPSVRMYFAGRLTSPNRVWVPEWRDTAEDDRSAIEKIAAHLKRQIDVGSGYTLSDIVSLKAPDQTIVKEGTVADFLSAFTRPHA